MGVVGAGCSLTSDGDDSDFWGHVQEAAGLFVPLGDGSRKVELLGCAPQGGLRVCIDRMGSKRALVSNANLALLDSSGARMGQYFVNDVTPEAVRPSTRGAGLVDLTVRLWCDNALPQSEWPWELIRAGQMNRTGLWHSLGPAGRRGWLSVALTRHSFRSLPDRPSGATYHLDGEHIVDEDGFYCALGEAVNGPGGYFGWNLDALDDCLRGRWGAKSPFTLEWHSSSVA